MLNGGTWKSRALETVRKTFQLIMQSSKITDSYDQHKEMLMNVLNKNKWVEKLEFVTVGWIENYEKSAKINVKLTKRNSDYITQRLEIFKTKTKILQTCKEFNTQGKI